MCRPLMFATSPSYSPADLNDDYDSDDEIDLPRFTRRLSSLSLPRPCPCRTAPLPDIIVFLEDAKEEELTQKLQRERKRSIDLVYGLEWQLEKEEDALHNLNKKKIAHEENMRDAYSHIRVLTKFENPEYAPLVEKAKNEIEMEKWHVEGLKVDIARSNTKIKKLDLNARVERARIEAMWL